MNILQEIYQVTRASGTKLILIGPMLYPANERVNNICLTLNKRVSRLAFDYQLPHIDIATIFDSEGNRTTDLDGKHLTAVGHALIAKGICTYMFNSIIQPAMV